MKNKEHTEWIHIEQQIVNKEMKKNDEEEEEKNQTAT